MNPETGAAGAAFTAANQVFQNHQTYVASLPKAELMAILGALWFSLETKPASALILTESLASLHSLDTTGKVRIVQILLVGAVLRTSGTRTTLHCHRHVGITRKEREGHRCPKYHKESKKTRSTSRSPSSLSATAFMISARVAEIPRS